MQDLNNLTPEIQNDSLGNNYLIQKMSKDMNFVGLATIIYGAINCITIIGAVIGVPLIFMGLRIRESADFFELFRNSGDQSALSNALEKQYKYFNIQKILIIVSLVFIALYIVVIIGLISAFGSHFSSDIYSAL